MRGLFAPFLAACLWLSFGLVAVQAQTATNLRVGFPGPYGEYLQTHPNGTFSGIDADLMAALCARLDLSCTWQRIDLQDIFIALQQGRIDVAIGGLGVSPARAALVSFTCPYVATGAYGEFFSVNPQADPNRGTVSVTSGSLHHQALQASGHDLRGYADSDQAIDAVLSGQAAFYFGDPGPVSRHPTAADLLSVVGTRDLADYSDGTAIAVTPSRPDLLEQLNAALASLSASGWLLARHHQHFGRDQGAAHADCIPTQNLS